MVLVNHLKNKDTQNMFLEVAYGLHLVEGDLGKSLTDDGHIYVQHKLGQGEWDSCLTLWWRGFGIPPANFKLHPGSLSSGNDDPVQGVDEIFDMDIPHSLTAWIRAMLPDSEIGDLDATVTAPEGLYGIYKTRKVNDYDDEGNVIGYSYSANPARIVADLILVIGKRDPNRINWVKWCEWRDYLDTLELVDYRTILNFDGFGLTGSYFNGTSFDTLISKRVDPVVEFALSAGSPANGLNTDNFSARYEGYIKPRFTELYTIYLSHNDGAKLWLDEVLLIDNWSGAADDSFTVSLTAEDFHKIKIEWKDTSGDASILLEWESASQPREVIPAERLYPKEEYRPKYEVHVFFRKPTRLDDGVKTVLNLCNSWFQRVDGKYEFFCFEQLTESTFTFDEEINFYPDSVEVIPRDPTRVRNVWQCALRDLDSQYFEQLPASDRPATIMIELPDLIGQAGQRINGDNFDFFNMTRWQGFKLLTAKMSREALSPEAINLMGNAETYSVLAGDRTKINLEFLNLVNYECLVNTSNDKSSETTADDRDFSLKKWVA